MSKICPITKSGPRKAGKYANRTRATIFTPIPKVYKFPNLQTKTIYIPELKKSMKIRASNKGFRTIKKNGAFAALSKVGIIK